MTIDQIIVHRLKKVREGSSELVLRNTALRVDPAADHLLQELTSIYEKKTGKAYGIFQPNCAEYPFSTDLRAYLNDGDFTLFTRKAMVLLQAKIDLAPWATGGYVVFILYRHQTTPHDRYLIVVMLNDRHGTAVDERTLEIRDVVHLVLDELHLGARIDIPAWLSGSSKQYLSFIKGPTGGASVSRYFRDFVGCTDYVDAVGQSRLLVRAIREYQKRSSSPRASVAATVAYGYASDRRKNDEPIVLKDLSSKINPSEPEEFLELVNSEEFRISDGFDPDLATLRPLGRFHYSSDDLTISFATRLLGSVIRYDEKKRALTIYPLPEELRKQLEKAL